MFKKILINSLIIFAISVLFHSMYNYLPITPVNIFAPVNESLFEHMKMIFSSYMFLILIIYLFYKHKPNNYITSNVIGSLFNIVIFLIIYLPIYNLFGENLIVTLIIYFITIVITSILKGKIEKHKNNKKYNIIFGISIIVIYIIFAILTFIPPKNNFFKDPTNNTYGIYKLNE